MGIFKRNTLVDHSAANEETAKRIADGILSRQRKFADYLNARAKFISPGKLKVILFLFCLGFGAYCLYLLYGPFN